MYIRLDDPWGENVPVRDVNADPHSGDDPKPSSLADWDNLIQSIQSGDPERRNLSDLFRQQAEEASRQEPRTYGRR